LIRHQLRFHGKWLIAIAFFAVIAAAAATWIFTNQRLRTPFADRYTVRVEFANTQSLTVMLVKLNRPPPALLVLSTNTQSANVLPLPPL